MRTCLLITLSVAFGCGGTDFSAGLKGDAGSEAGRGGRAGDGGARAGGRGGENDAGTGAVSSGGASAGGMSQGGVSAGGYVGNGGSGGSGGSAGRGTGGHVLTGGTSGTGGSAGGGGGVPPNCTTAITFKVVPGGPAGGSQFCTTPPGCNQPGFPFSLGFTDASGKAIQLDAPCSYTNCGTCSSSPCPPGHCQFSGLIPASGTTTTWSGTELSSGTCGNAVSCLGFTCVPEGSYVAHMCGYAVTGVGGAGGGGGAGGMIDPCAQYASKTPTCVDVPFTLPTSNVVTGVLDPRK